VRYLRSWTGNRSTYSNDGLKAQLDANFGEIEMAGLMNDHIVTATKCDRNE